MVLEYNISQTEDCVVLEITAIAPDIAGILPFEYDFCRIDFTTGRTFGTLGFGELSIVINPDELITLTSPAYESATDRETLIARITLVMEQLNG